MKNKNKKCLVTECENNAFCKGLCSKHYQQIKFNGKVKEKTYLTVSKFCKNLNCSKTIFAKGFCQSCYTKSRNKNLKND
jgi:hypothetical protein